MDKPKSVAHCSSASTPDEPNCQAERPPLLCCQSTGRGAPPPPLLPSLPSFHLQLLRTEQLILLPSPAVGSQLASHLSAQPSISLMHAIPPPHPYRPHPAARFQYRLVNSVSGRSKCQCGRGEAKGQKKNLASLPPATDHCSKAACN